MTPRVHYSPARGWLNDPNGLVYAGGRHHLFYQHNPAGTTFANQHWGHASSPDLLTWTEHRVALAPGPDPYDAVACFSGCAVPLPDGRTAFLYTGVAADRATRPCLAFASGALGTLVKDPGNPVIGDVPDDGVTDFRDHAVWHDGDRWRQLVAGARPGRGGALFGYASDDLREWAYQGVFVDRDTVGVPGDVWECPDRIAPGALVVSVIGARPEVWWMTGREVDGRLDADRSGPCDVGDRFYAPQSYDAPDGRRIQFGWIRTHEDPAAGGPAVGVVSLPRELTVRGGRVRSAPAAEVLDLRRSPVVAAVDGTLGEPVVAGELVFTGTGATLYGGGVALDVALGPGDQRIFWDAGIVEAFRDGLAGTWTDLRMAAVDEIRLRGATGPAEIWRLGLPDTG